MDTRGHPEPSTLRINIQDMPGTQQTPHPVTSHYHHVLLSMLEDAVTVGRGEIVVLDRGLKIG